MRRLKLMFALMAVLVAVAACSSDDGSGGGGATESAESDSGAAGGYGGGTGESDGGGDAAAAGDGGVALTATGNTWSPAAIELAAGADTSVTVENTDGVRHSFTFEDAQVDQDIEGGETATIEFTAPAAGEYEFICKYHSSMTGTVTVA